MKEYFTLQYKLTGRKIPINGCPTLVSYLLILIGFWGFSIFLLHKTSFAPYLLIFIALSMILKLSEARRNDFLKTLFEPKKRKLIRCIENEIIALPFIAIMLFKLAFLPALILFVAAPLLAVVEIKTPSGLTLPTPFKKSPFEFTVGFRNTYFLFPIAYGLALVSVYVGNSNLGLFSILLLFITTYSYYSKPEHEYFVWIHSLSPKQFLFTKIKTAFINVLGLLLPILVLFILTSQDLVPILSITVIGLAFLATIILAKYAAYPREMMLPEALLIAICVSFPPLLLGVIPYFYKKSKSNLSPILHDSH